MRGSVDELIPGDIYSFPSDDAQYRGRTLRDDVALAMMSECARRNPAWTYEAVVREALKYADAYLVARKEDL